MHFEGRVNIRAPREKVWAFLTDPKAVSQCAPGVESLEEVVPGKKFRATASVGLGGIKARFTGDGEFVELDEPNRARLVGRGNASGSAVDVSSEMLLSDGPDGTTDLKWAADVIILGTLASLASRMMGGVTQKLSAEFFNCVKARIEQ